MRQKANYHYLLALLLIPSCVQASIGCERAVAQIMSAQGKVDAQRGDGHPWLLVHEQDEFCPGDKIRTDKHSRATLRMGNESVLTVEQTSMLMFPEPEHEPNAPQWLVGLLSGTSFFRSRQPQQLHIKTPFINAVHEGTEFLVSVDGERTEITVFEGQISGHNQAGSIRIVPGYVGIAPKNSPPHVEPLKIKPVDAVQWVLYYPPLIDFRQIDYKKLANLQRLAPDVQGTDGVSLLKALDAVPIVQQDSYYLTLKASLLLSVGRVDEAQGPISQLLLYDPHDSGALALQAVIAVSKNQQDDALVLAKKAVAANSRSVPANLALSYAYQAFFKLEEAVNATRAALTAEPNNALVLARLAELQLSLGLRHEALQAAQKAQAINPKLAKTQTVLGFAHLAQLNIKESKLAFNQAIALDASDPLAWLGGALADIRAGELGQGTRKLETAASLDPNNAVIRSYLGKAQFEQRQPEFAETEFSIAKASDDKDPTPWFYDAILKQSTNRPVAALEDMLQAVALNDNRAVYRSRLLLDKDAAVRGTGLGRIFNDLGFNEIANRQAVKSLAVDPGNYSAQRLLADSSADQPREEIARASALLQSQLLQSASLNPIQPRLAYTDLNMPKSVGPAEVGFNEYNKVFERDSFRLTNTTTYGSFNSLGNEAVLSGIANKLSYSIGQLHYQNDGFRANNGLKNDLYNVFAQYALSPQWSLQAEYRRRDTNNGDLQLKGDSSNFDPNYQRTIGQDTYRFGSRFSPDDHSNWLTSLIYAKRNEFVNNGGGLNSSANSNGYQLESAYLLQQERYNLTVGGGRYAYNNQNQFISGNPFICLELGCQLSASESSQNFAYGYSNIKLRESLTATVGLSYDNYADGHGNHFALESINPKLGLLWQINKQLLFRAAAFNVVKSPIVVDQLLQPMQIAGFNQFFDDVNGAKAGQYGFGVDYHPAQHWYTGVEVYSRQLKSPYISGDAYVIEQRAEDLYRFYVNWLIHKNWTINSGFRYEDFYSQGNVTPKAVNTAYLPTSLRFFHATGFFAELRGTYVNQQVNQANLGQDSFVSGFFLVDAAIGYRLPKQYGLLSLEAKNLLDNHFRYRDRNFQMNELRASDIIPVQTLSARFTFNF